MTLTCQSVGLSVGRAGPGSVLCRLVLKKRTDPVQAAASAPAVAAPPAAVRVEAQVFLKCLEGAGWARSKIQYDPLLACFQQDITVLLSRTEVSSPPPIALDLEACDCWCGGIIIFFCSILHPMTQLKQTSAKHAQDVPL